MYAKKTLGAISMFNFKVLILFTVFILFPDSAGALDRAFTVDGNGGAEFAYIQDAIEEASDGDTIIVYPYTYKENIRTKGKELHIFSTAGALVTTIEGTGVGPVIEMANLFMFPGRYFKQVDGTIQGFTITNGNASAGGGVYIGNGESPMVTENIITGNTSSSWGGGIYTGTGSKAQIIGNIIDGNSAVDGGGIACWQSEPEVSGNIIISNSASNRGGGLLCFELFSSPEISSNLFESNYAAYGGAIGVYDNCNPVINGNTVTGNIADYHGGAIYVNRNCDPLISNNFIIKNEAGNLGGGIVFNDDCSGEVYFNTFYSNSAELSGGGLVCWYLSSPVIGNNIVAGSTSGGGIYCDYGGSYPYLFNNDFWNNIPADYLGSAEPGEDDYSADPVFEVPGSEGTDTHLTRWSPCINRARDIGIMDDAEGESRPYRGGPDTGADEHHGPFNIPVPESFEVIQDAVDSAYIGDYVMVGPGTYMETIDFTGKDIRINSTSGNPDSTIIDGDGNGPVFTLIQGETVDAEIRGFTIRGGSADRGGGVLCDGSSPAIEGNIIRNNSAVSEGGGIYSSFGSPVIRNNTLIHNNSVKGGAVFSESGGGEINSNIIAYNIASDSLGGGIFGENSSVSIDHNDFWENEGCDYVQVEPGKLNLFLDPVFLDPLLSTCALDPRSPCINGGDTESEVPAGGKDRIDIGACEFMFSLENSITFRFSETVDSAHVADLVEVPFTITNLSEEDTWIWMAIDVDGPNGRWFFLESYYIPSGEEVQGYSCHRVNLKEFPEGELGLHNVYGKIGRNNEELLDISDFIIDILPRE